MQNTCANTFLTHTRSHPSAHTCTCRILWQTCGHTRMYTREFRNAHTHVSSCKHVHTHTCTNMHTQDIVAAFPSGLLLEAARQYMRRQVHIYVYVYICIHTHTNQYVYMYIHTYTHIFIYIYICIYIYMCVFIKTRGSESVPVVVPVVVERYTIYLGRLQPAL